MVIVPEESLRMNKPSEQEPESIKEPTKKRIERDIDKIQKLILIVLKIARHNGYDENFNLLDENGKVIDKSDLVSLLNHSLTHQKLFIGGERFIQLLHEAKVDPNRIINDNMRSKLLSITERPITSHQSRTTVSPERPRIRVSPGRPRITESPPPDIRVLNQELKRKRDEESDRVPFKKSKIDWDILSDDDDD